MIKDTKRQMDRLKAQSGPDVDHLAIGVTIITIMDYNDFGPLDRISGGTQVYFDAKETSGYYCRTGQVVHILYNYNYINWLQRHTSGPQVVHSGPPWQLRYCTTMRYGNDNVVHACYPTVIHCVTIWRLSGIELCGSKIENELDHD